jgi:hypothetical protein
MLTARFRLVCSAYKRSGAMMAPDFLSEFAIDFVSDLAENAGHRSVVILGTCLMDLMRPSCGYWVVISMVL